MKDYANMRAVMEGAGVEGNKYSDFLPFSLGEIDAFIGLLILNGLSPNLEYNCGLVTPLCLGIDISKRDLKMVLEDTNTFGVSFVCMIQESIQ